MCLTYKVRFRAPLTSGKDLILQSVNVFMFSSSFFKVLTMKEVLNMLHLLNLPVRKNNDARQLYLTAKITKLIF